MSSSRLTVPLAVCATVFAVITVSMALSDEVRIGFFGHVAGFVSGTLFTTLGVLAGDVFRRFARPDLLLARSTMELFDRKVFWLVGPQVIGWIAGFIASQGFMRNVLGYVI